MTTVIVGGGAAADGAVSGIRDAGAGGAIVIVGAEPMPPYERPPLSKGYLLGHVDRSSLLLRRPDAYAGLGVEVRTGERAVRIDVERRSVELESGAAVPYEKLLIATGGQARRLDSVPRALYLRSVEDADRLRAQLRESGRFSIVGAGFIGCEVAAAATLLGSQVTVLEALSQPLTRVLGEEMGAFIADVHRSRGVDLRTNVGSLPALEAPVLVAIGSEPNTAIAEQAGLRVDAGILVDEFGQSSHEDVFAAGDVARFYSPLFKTHVRVEHFQTAWRHGYAVGQSVAGRRQQFGEAPWFWSDQYDLNIQYVGAALPWDQLVVRGAVGQPPFSVFYLRAGQLLAAAGVDDGRTISQARRLLEAGVNPSPDELADRSVDLKRLLRSSGAG